MLKALFILPVTCFAIYAFATPEANVLTPQVKKTVATQQQKATPTTQQKKATPTTQQKKATPATQQKKATPATQQQKKAVATTQQKATSNPQKKDVTVQIKTDKENVTGTLQKEKAEQLAKDIKAKLGDKATVTISDSAPSDTIYGVVDELPQFPGGESAMYKWIAQHMKYPKEAMEKEISGRVTIQFVVEKNGDVTNAKALRAPDPILSEEALRVVNAMPKWKPGKNNKGETVRCHYRLPITFRLAPCQPTKE
jgi:TonB family protein